MAMSPGKRLEAETLCQLRAEIHADIAKIFSRVEKRNKMWKDGILSTSPAPGQTLPPSSCALIHVCRGEHVDVILCFHSFQADLPDVCPVRVPANPFQAGTLLNCLCFGGQMSGRERCVLLKACWTQCLLGQVGCLSQRAMMCGKTTASGAHWGLGA
jgi:hypothetical protein